jgi:hypothetical protein
MSPKAQLEAFAQDLYLTIKNRFYDEIEGEDGQTYVYQVSRWLNMFVDELEQTTGPDGGLVDWWFTRSNGYSLGTVTEGTSSTSMPSAVGRLITDEMRYVQILQDNAVISNWAVVHPKDISNRSDRITEDMCAQVGNTIVFSRTFRDTEANGTIVGDVILKLPRIGAKFASSTVTVTNIKLLTMVEPLQLLTLGAAKNATLPDIVQGVLSPSYAQKFNDLMQGAIARSNATSVAATAARDNYSNVRGV